MHLFRKKGGSRLSRPRVSREERWLTAILAFIAVALAIPGIGPLILEYFKAKPTLPPPRVVEQPDTADTSTQANPAPKA